MRPRKEFDDIFRCLDITHKPDRETDRHRPTAKTALMHSITQ